jgi:hypothetical protein
LDTQSVKKSTKVVHPRRRFHIIYMGATSQPTEVWQYDAEVLGEFS